MDHFWPFDVQRAKKVWGLLLICLTTGAVHLEPVDNLTVQGHLNAFDRFIARRGKPTKIRSDKGRTFVGGAKEHNELTTILANKSFQDELAAEAKRRWRIDFEFNVEYTPHHGGKWEGMVKEFKRSLSKAVDSVAKMTYDALSTLLVHAKGILNQMPLAITNDLRVITPMQLLQPASEAAFCFQVGQSVPRIYEQTRQSVEYFWQHWRSHYLALMSVERLAKGYPRFINLAVGDRVLLRDNFKSSNVFAKPMWVPVRVTKTHPSSDGAVRTVTVEKADGEELTLTTNKLAIVEEDLLDHYEKSQGLRTVNREAQVVEEEENSDRPTTTSNDLATSASTPAESTNDATKKRQGRPKGVQNRRWKGDKQRYSLRSQPPTTDELTNPNELSSSIGGSVGFA
jgi:hypothetical protein